MMTDDEGLVLVDWLDSHLEAGWQGDETVNISPMICQSVGWLLRENGESLVVAPHRTAAGENNGIMVIPMVAVRSVRRLAAH